MKVVVTIAFEGDEDKLIVAFKHWGGQFDDPTVNATMALGTWIDSKVAQLLPAGPEGWKIIKTMAMKG